jgi:capsular polysaccharide transport system permease protein
MRSARLPTDQHQSLPHPQFATLRTIVALMLREMGGTYGRSPGGYLWAILEPMAAIFILAIAFGILFRSPPLGTSFILFYATGYLPFDLYGTLSTKVGSALSYSRPLLAYPAVTWLDAVLARFFLNAITDITVMCIVLIAIIQIENNHVVIDMVPVLTGVFLACLFGLGIGMINSILKGLFPVWKILWDVVNRPLFLISGVFFLYEDMPRFLQDILWWNPLLHMTSWVRTGFYPNYDASFVSLPYCFLVALTLIVLGLVLVRGYHKTIME